MPIRIERPYLNAAIAKLCDCTLTARDENGLRIYWQPTCAELERAVLGALTFLAPGGGTVAPSNVHEIHLNMRELSLSDGVALTNMSHPSPEPVEVDVFRAMRNAKPA